MNKLYITKVKNKKISPWDRNEPLKEELREVFEYRNGWLYWKISTASRVKIGARAGWTASHYYTVCFKGEAWVGHRIIWIYHYGAIPKGFEIDHKNEIKLDNRIKNLRLSTSGLNRANVLLIKTNTSGHKGVNWNQQARKWRTQMIYKGKMFYFGNYDTKEDAISVYRKRSVEILGEFSPYFNDKPPKP